MPLIDERERLALESLPPVAVVTLAERMGVTVETVKAWTRKGYLATKNLCGQNYVTAAEMVAFNRRLESGEFAVKKTPPRGRVAASRERGQR